MRDAFAARRLHKGKGKPAGFPLLRFTEYSGSYFIYRVELVSCVNDLLSDMDKILGDFLA